MTIQRKSTTQKTRTNYHLSKVQGETELLQDCLDLSDSSGSSRILTARPQTRLVWSVIFVDTVPFDLDFRSTRRFRLQNRGTDKDDLFNDKYSEMLNRV